MLNEDRMVNLELTQQKNRFCFDSHQTDRTAVSLWFLEFLKGKREAELSVFTLSSKFLSISNQAEDFPLQ